MSKTTKTNIFFVITFSLSAILFALLHYFNILPQFDLYLACTYVAFFLGMALLCYGSYQNSKEHYRTALFSYILGILLCLVAIFLLVYGFVTGWIVLGWIFK